MWLSSQSAGLLMLKHDGIKTYTANRLAEELRGMISEDLALVEE